MTIKKKIIYTTDDGQSFDNEALATAHQKELDNFDYKTEFFKLRKEFRQ